MRSARRRRADELPALVRAERGDAAVPALTVALARAMAARFAALVAEWQALPDGDALSFDWPALPDGEALAHDEPAAT